MKTTETFTKTRRGNRARKGAAMVGMIGVMLIMGVLGVSMVSMTRTSESSHLTANAGSRAFFLAESGLRYAQTIHAEEGWRHGRQRVMCLQGGEKVNVIRLAGRFWATSIVHEGAATEARARVPMDVNWTFNPPNPPNVVIPSSEDNRFVVFGNQPYLNKGTMNVVGDIGMIEEIIEIKGDVDGSVMGHDVDFTAHGAVKVDVFASGFVDVHVGTVVGDIHSVEGVNLRSSPILVDGWIFTEGNVQLAGGSHVCGHVHSRAGHVLLTGSATIGTPTNPVEVRAAGDVIISGSAKIYGTVYAGGSINGGGNIHGDAYAGGTIGGVIVSGDQMSNAGTYMEFPIAPDLRRLVGLALPTPAVFNVSGDDVGIPSAGSVILPPGTYSDLATPNNAQGASLYLKAGLIDDGNYYLNSLSLGGNSNLYLDLSGTHDIRIFVKNNIDVGQNLNTYVSTDGVNYKLMTDPSADPKLAQRVYWESHQDFGIAQNAWFGTVYTPYGITEIEGGSHLIGATYSGGGHNLKGGTAEYQPSSYLLEQ